MEEGRMKGEQIFMSNIFNIVVNLFYELVAYTLEQGKTTILLAPSTMPDIFSKYLRNESKK